MRILGYIFLGVIIFIVGYGIGSSPSQEETTAKNQQTQAATDLSTVSDKYSQLYTLCEQKYQTALNGNYYDAIRINGQMDSLVAEIDRILAKYNYQGL